MIDFGFRVDKMDRGSEAPEYAVSLPHQCDRWHIVGEAEWGEGEIKGIAVLQLTEFIEQAKRALEELIKE